MVYSNSLRRREELSEKEDPFDRLPDDLIVSHVVDKICVPKSLCSISLLSRRFSALIHQTQVVSVKINPSLACPAGEVLDLETATKFLVRFRHINSLYVEVGYSWNLTGDDIDPIVVKWWMDSESASFMLLTAGNLQLGSTEDFNGRGNSIMSRETNNLLKWFFNYCMGMGSHWFKFVEKLVHLLPESLQEVVVADSTRNGKFHFGERDIIQMRNGNSNFGAGDANIRVWHLPFLKLPLSGCGMEIVTLFISKGTSKSEFDDSLIGKEAFDGEDDQQIYAEAVKEMLKRDFVLEEFVPAQHFSFRLSLN